jgi:hypothetical protein
MDDVQRAAGRLARNPDFITVMADLTREYQTALWATADAAADEREIWFRKFRAIDDLASHVQAKADEGKRDG